MEFKIFLFFYFFNYFLYLFHTSWILNLNGILFFLKKKRVFFIKFYVPLSIIIRIFALESLGTFLTFKNSRWMDSYGQVMRPGACVFSTTDKLDSGHTYLWRWKTAKVQKVVLDFNYARIFKEKRKEKSISDSICGEWDISSAHVW
jgi:hypothetical protein